MKAGDALAEQRRWNDTARVYDAVAIPIAFEQQAARTPDAVALELEGATVTYRELAERSARLAGYLRARGVGPDVLCALCVERSFEMVVGLLGIMRAGGAYVPLNPGYPRDRLAFMAAECGAPLVLTQAALLDRLPPMDAQTTCLDRDWPSIAEAAPFSAPAPRDDQLIYMIYTSGSTGQPKGALNHHAGVRNRIAWMHEAYRLTADDRVLQKTPFSFDVSVWEFFWPLTVGARLVVARPEGHRDPEYLSRLIEGSGVTVLHFVPSMLAVFLESGGLESRCRGVAQVMCSGEALPFETTQRFFARLPRARLHNLYGPTEAAVDVTSYECKADAKVPMVPIGKPVANTQIWIVDEKLAPVAPGAEGELYIGGVQVGRGYHRRPELTAERFVGDPFTPGGKIYRSGDLARFLPDGNIEYLGRIDHQVKIRGFRIELGEIEGALRAQPGVRDVVVVARRERPGDEKLVAYLVGEGLEARVLRRELGAKLPDYMVPSAFVFLPALPLSPNGKVDRKALPAPVAERPRHDAVAPRDNFELKLLGLWEGLFEVRPLGVTDDFFELGGNSLQAVRLVAEIDAAFQRRLAPAELLRSPTIEKLAVTLRAADADVPSSPLVPLQIGTTRPLFLVHPIGGNVLCYVDLARRLGREQTVYGLQSRGFDGLATPLTSNDEIAASYVEAIRAVQPHGPYHLGGFSSGGVVACLMAMQLLDAGEPTTLLFNLDGRRPMPDIYSSAVKKTHNFEDAMMAFWLLVILGRSLGLEIDAEYEDFQPLDDDQRVDLLLRRLQQHGLMPEGVGRKQMRATLDVYKANMRAIVSTTLRPYPHRMILIKAKDKLPDRHNTPNPPPWHWEDMVAELEEHWVPSTHFMLLGPAAVGHVAEVMRVHLARANQT